MRERQIAGIYCDQPAKVLEVETRDWPKWATDPASRAFLARIDPQTSVTMACDSGYEAGAEDAGSGELLEDALALRYAFYDLDGKTKRAVALHDLVMGVQSATMEHEEDCGCGICRALEAVT